MCAASFVAKTRAISFAPDVRRLIEPSAIKKPAQYALSSVIASKALWLRECLICAADLSRAKPRLERSPQIAWWLTPYSIANVGAESPLWYRRHMEATCSDVSLMLAIIMQQSTLCQLKSSLLNHPSSIHISMHNQTTTCTNVFALRKKFLFPLAATAAILGRVGWVDLLHLTASVFSFANQDHQESSPSDTCDRTGEHSARQPFDVQIFEGARVPKKISEEK